MNEDIEWLKDEIKVFQNGENMFTAEFNAGVQQALEYVQELIDQLEEPETLSEEWINEHSKSYTMENAVEISDLKNLLLPQPKKPVIPQHVADWIDTHNLYGNNPLREYRDLEIDFNEGWTDEKDAAVHHWVNKNPYVFIDALRYGYEVEKEKLYRVIFPHKSGYNEKMTLMTNGGYYYIDEVTDPDFEVAELTEREIKAIDERYWAFVEEVTE